MWKYRKSHEIKFHAIFKLNVMNDLCIRIVWQLMSIAGCESKSRIISVWAYEA